MWRQEKHSRGYPHRGSHHRRLKDLVRQGEFRADLFYRLNTINLYIPPLRERISDIEALITHFLKECRRVFGCSATGVSKDFLRRLKLHSWPGNVRELQHVLAEASIMEDGETLMGYSFQPEPQAFPVAVRDGSREAREDERHLREALARTGGNKARAARLLGISRKTLYQRLEKYGIPTKDYSS